MQIVRFATGRKIGYGVLEENVIRGFRGSPFTLFKRFDSSFPLDGSDYHLEEVRLLAPCLPSKIVCLGLNYRSHAEETQHSVPTVPLIFLKPSTAVIGPDDRIILPRHSRRVDYEAELGVVIGRKAKDVTEDKAKEYIIGYTCFNDVTERHNQADDGQWTRAKGYDTFAPVGPGIETEVDPDDLKIETYLNGERRQCARTSDLIFGISRLISFISGIMTLLPGDVVATGTPSGIGPLSPGDVVEVRIENVGTLRNPVVRYSPSSMSQSV
ncbi:MAG: fumarylacetoacetate hydrolase family protein [Dehalococcoidia bacterium]|nr:Ureidoglycolate lyase [Chloroflexota bacterium]MBT9161187.1 Ureidoglycolate lyase [Chloroflexota bacterium]MBT9162532.1 Ureidoglycolate lyase [Chloroflexota bacterium]